MESLTPLCGSIFWRFVMKRERLVTSLGEIPVYILDTAVIGSGCAGFNAADCLFELGKKDVAVFTEGVKMGTSRNTGSDKQTYYKLSLSSGESDSVTQMAETLFSGGGVHGDIALAEAAGSVRGFIKLANLGVPFPTTEYGEYAGYKTDHDPVQRASSAGPLTSKMMTECLEKAVQKKDIPVVDGMTVFELLVQDNRIFGFIAIDRKKVKENTYGITVVYASHVILATGGPAGCYQISVYPESQTGMSGMALIAGAAGANLQEWQYGIASTLFRWNVSGTYQQVLPRYVSIGDDGIEHEFLPDYFETPAQALNQVFLKGYQWPFDSRKIQGSSMIDMIISHEILTLGRRVYMDFRQEPKGLENGFSELSDEARNYLSNSGALEMMPIRRLAIMNPPAIALYQDHGIDLYSEMLEVNVCAQHHNGGLAVDANWQTTIEGLYAAGEAAGTFGSYRPGGSALNSTQVGSRRAAEHIVYEANDLTISKDIMQSKMQNAVENVFSQFKRVDFCDTDLSPDKNTDEQNAVHTSNDILNGKKFSGVKQQRKFYARQFSRFAAHIRRHEEFEEMINIREHCLADFFSCTANIRRKEIPFILQSRDILYTQKALLSAMSFAAEELGSRGSAVVTAPKGESLRHIPDYCFSPELREAKNERIVTVLHNGIFQSSFETVNKIPETDGWFENVWSAYRKRTGLE